MKILCVAEKPSIAKSISEILSSGGNGYQSRPGKDKYCRNFTFQYRFPLNHSLGLQLPSRDGFVDMVVTSVKGHLMSTDFTEPFRKWQSCRPIDLFTAPIETYVSKESKDVASNLKQEARGVDLLMIWTDCDREGENIGAEVVKVCRQTNSRIKVKRARFSAIIANQIHRAAQHPVELDWHAAEAVESRIELDLRLGAAFTRMQCFTLQQRHEQLQSRVISYGPCQFPTLGFVVDRYIVARDFVPQDFWYIAMMDKRNEVEVTFHWSRNHLFDRQAVLTIYQRCRAHPEATVTKVTSKQTRKFKPSPLTTVELQKSGGRLLKMAPKRVLDIAEKLYQRGILSYPRTETDQYDKDFNFHSLIEKQVVDTAWGAYAARLMDTETQSFESPINGSKNDKAHPPIHPTRHASDLTGDDKRVYDYITRRFLGSCSKHAIGRQTTVELDIAKEIFSANGIVVVERNFLEVYTFDKWGGPALPEYYQDERFRPTKMEMKKGETSRPKLLTEADLVSLMDRNGIGTDATIAEHIAKIIERDYVKLLKEGQINYLIPSELGMGLVEGYNTIEFDGNKSLCKPLLRRETEESLTLICQGTKTKQETLQQSLDEYKAVFEKTMLNIEKLERRVGANLRGEYVQGDGDVERVIPQQDVDADDISTPEPSSNMLISRSSINHLPSNGAIEVVSLHDESDEEAENFQVEGPRSRAAKMSSNKGRPDGTTSRSRQQQGDEARQYGTSSRSNGIGHSNACFRCGETGHWGKDCPTRNANNWSASVDRSRPESSSNANNNNQTCFSCGNQGHWASDCPDKNAARATKKHRGGSSTANLTRGRSTRGASGSTNRARGRSRGVRV